MAIPGSPLDPRSRGCNQLIREGETLVQNASVIAELIRPLYEHMQSSTINDAARAKRMADDVSIAECSAVIDLLGMTCVSGR